MTTLAAFGGFDLVLTGSMILLAIFLLRRTAVRSKRSRNRDVLTEVRDDFRKTEKSAARNIQRLEVRLYDYGREIEGQVQTRMSMLERLLEDAEHEAARLRQVLADSRAQNPEPARTASSSTGRLTSSSPEDNKALAGEQRGMIVHLFDAGYSPEQIATLTSRPAELITAVLEAERPRRAA